jgi:CheY-like chemotaxis protein
MDATSCWHWLKHSISEDWRLGHNVVVEAGAMPRITFTLAVHPQTSSSVPYWLTQLRRPIARVLYDEGASQILLETWGLQIAIKTSQDMSTPVRLGAVWKEIEHKALSAGRKCILVIDDEVRKMEDLLLPLMDSYHVIFSPNAKDALEKLAATRVDLAIVDLQIGSGFQWSAEETKDFKLTGVRLCSEIRTRSPDTKVSILTGSRHDLSAARRLPDLSFLHKKPIDPDHFEKEVRRVLA